ncbi:MAG: hypothetical protein IT320_04705 [Anaerolineae bacterium]|nr:hypothetical protein [Anaerolineae bacterium]
MTTLQTSLTAHNPSRRRTRQNGRFGIGLAMIIFPIVAIFIYGSHPNLLSLQPIHEVDAWIAEWHGNAQLHFAHVLMLLCVPLLIAITTELMSMLRAKGRWYGFVGGILAVTGAVFLAADKGALCLVTSAFDTLSAAEFQQIHPAIAAMKGMQGWLWLVYGLVLLPIGFVTLGVGLYRTGGLPRWQAGLLIGGSALLLNPDIEIISLAASVLLALALVPLGVRRIREATARA